MNNKRITEEIDSDGISRFYPERKVLGMWWWRYNIENYGPDTGTIAFNTYEEAKNWVCYKHTVKTNILEVDCE